MNMISNKNSEAADRWDSVQNRISGWLNERQELIHVFCILSDLGKKTSDDKILSKTVQQFCVILMDYVSAGHFEIYDELVAEAKTFNDSNVSIIDHVYPEIDNSTEIALVFNDKFELQYHDDALFQNITTDLQNLGQSLELRFELEDLLIEKLHLDHKVKVA